MSSNKLTPILLKTFQNLFTRKPSNYGKAVGKILSFTNSTHFKVNLEKFHMWLKNDHFTIKTESLKSKG